MRRLHLGVLAAGVFASIGTEQALALTAGDGVCTSPLDYGSSWIIRPHIGACTPTSCAQGNGGTTYQRWTRDRVAACDGCIVEIGDDEQTLNLLSGNDIPSQPDAGFALNFNLTPPATTVPLSSTNMKKYIDDVNARVPAGHSGPIFVYAMRWDLLNRHDLDRTGNYGSGNHAPQASWVLRSDRDFTAFANWFRGAGAGAQSDQARCDSVAGGANDGLACGWTHCRNFSETSLFTDELYSAPEGGLHCNRTYDFTTQREFGARTYDLLNAISPGLADDAVWSISRVSDNTKVFNGSSGGVFANMLDTSYQDAMVELCAEAIALGYDACDFPHKNHFYWFRGGGSLAQRQLEFWLDINDTLGGYNGDANLCPTDSGVNGIFVTLDTIPELVLCETALSGPPERPNGDPWQWDDYALAQVEIARALYNEVPRLPYFRLVSPYWYVGCSSWDGVSTKIGSTYTTAGCEGAGGSASCASGGSNCGWDDHSTTPSADEAAYLREIVQRAAYVVIDLGGKAPTSASIGSGAGSGWSFETLKKVIENPQPGVPAPRVVGYYNPLGQENEFGAAPRLCANPAEENPLVDRLTP